MRTSHSLRRRRAFTLVETIIGAAIGAAIVAAAVLGSVTLLRTRKAVEAYSDGAIDQARVLDYIARDVRRATSATVAQSPPQLTLTIPDQYANATKADRTFRKPSVGGATVTYGSGTVKLVYYLSGKNFVRQENGVNSIIASNVTGFVPVIDPADPNAKTVRTTITFAASFRWSAAAVSSAPTSFTNIAFLRNK